ncbi:MAG: AmmeMemoRadiSam system protein B [Armatimonadota bacterium]|nr:AmmeMemoRadiSam system protein B [bacterium]MCS7310566.1 AmmeMemoRadiSam system protein B [Armatimonadota bacterium]MDW8103368.1 AmmeMemoRadiSam system protein B [Armatimonadota bacterium]MDW8289230.1 AmmeMemoRadiSam system protein B [Armatimonadota bacterium]
MIRPPAVAGMFYAGSAAELREEIRECFLSPLGPGRLPESVSNGKRSLRGLMCPHAGYRYSGAAAAHAYARLAEDGAPETVILLGPNHRAIGAPIAILSRGSFKTPLGEVPIDATAAEAIKAQAPMVRDDENAHAPEHSLEVQLPFLQTVAPQARIVPIVFGRVYYDRETLEELKALGAVLAELLGDPAHHRLLLASTDLMHYVPRDEAYRMDEYVLQAVRAVDGERLLEEVFRRDISMCGVMSTAAMLFALRQLGITQGEVLCHYTSGDVPGGDTRHVVGYAACAFHAPA